MDELYLAVEGVGITFYLILKGLIVFFNLFGVVLALEYFLVLLIYYFLDFYLLILYSS